MQYYSISILHDNLKEDKQMYTVIGVCQKKGEYEGTPYNNVNFQCVQEFAEGKGIGQCAEVIKVASVHCIDEVKQVGSLGGCIGLNIRPYYNRFGKVDSILLTDPNVNTK